MQIKYLRLNKIYNIPCSNKHQESEKKKKKLDLYNKLISEGCYKKTSLEVIEISRATYFRWKKKYKEQGLDGLKNKSRCPFMVRKPTWDYHTEKLVISIRRKYKLWGKYKIAAILKREHGVKLSTSMVGRIISKHIHKNNIQPVEFYYGKIRSKKRRVINDHAKR